MIRQELADDFGDDLLFLEEDYFDSAIVGVTDTGRVVYDVDRLVSLFCDNNDCSYEDALEYIEFNTLGAYVGDQTPVYLQLKVDP